MSQNNRDCKYSDICGLQCWGGNDTCILHWENNGECLQDFRGTLKRLLTQGHANFQKVYFPVNDTSEFMGKTFNEILDFDGAHFSTRLNIGATTLKKGLKANGITLQAIILDGVTVEGPVEISGQSDKAVSIQATNARFKEKVFMKFLRLGGAHFSDATLEGSLSIEAGVLQHFKCDGAEFESCLEIQNCEIGIIEGLAKATFGLNAEVNLCYSKIQDHEGLTIEGKTVPKILRINGLKVEGPSTLAGPMANKGMKIIAETDAPSFGWDKDVVFKNVDLSECCLLGNNFQNFAFTNIQWARWHPWGIGLFERDVLKDEIVMREGKEKFPIKNLKDSYEILKREYERRGNMLQASYFHYGEIEMRRYAGGHRGRWFSLDFIYWLLSGYGLGWGRALGWVLLSILIPAGIYWGDNCGNSSYDCLDWLRHSFQVTTFQKPNLPDMEKLKYSNWTLWTQAIQSVWGPFQIALLGLAIRTRVKR